MIIRKTALILSFCLPAIFGAAQKAPPRKKFAVLVSPALLRAPGIEVGGQAGLQYQKGKWALNAEVAFPFDRTFTDFATIHAARLGIEIKRYVKDVPLVKPYVSLQTNYAIRQLVDTAGNTFFSAGSGWTQYKKAAVSAPIFTTALKWGGEFELGKRFFMDAFAGAGVRFTSVA